MKKTFIILMAAFMLFAAAGCSQPTLDIETQPTQVAVANTPEAEPTDEIIYKHVVDPYKPYTYDIMQSDIAELKDLYPQFIEVGSIGSSVEGRDLTLLKIGSGDEKLLLVGSHHAREYITSTYLMNAVDKYLSSAAKAEQVGGYDIAALLEKVTVYVVPMLNPDGVNLVINGVQSVDDVVAVSSMAMLKSTYAEWKANINGIDLNRQYPCHWDEKKQNTDEPSSEMFKGTKSASEPEVQAMMALCESNDFAIAASFHSKGEIVYWADSGTVDSVHGAESVTDAVCEVSGYRKMPVSEDPASYGAGFENWFRQEFSRPGLCIELTPSDGSSVPHDDAAFDNIVWNKAELIFAVLMKQADLYR